jgi:hypothetical protein
MNLPALQPGPEPAHDREWLASEFTRILTWRDGTADPRVVAALLLAAGQYAARMIEEHARPDERWGPK